MSHLSHLIITTLLSIKSSFNYSQTQTGNDMVEIADYSQFAETYLENIKSENFQIATHSITDEFASLRTMVVTEILENGTLLFLSNTKTEKWKELTENPHMTICLNKPKVQLIAKGKVKLQKSNDNLEFSTKIWSKLPTDVKKIYCKYIKNVPENFGLIYFQPSFWEVMIIKNPYIKSLRYLIYNKDKQWIVKKIKVKS